MVQHTTCAPVGAALAGTQGGNGGSRASAALRSIRSSPVGVQGASDLHERKVPGLCNHTCHQPLPDHSKNIAISFQRILRTIFAIGSIALLLFQPVAQLSHSSFTLGLGRKEAIEDT